MTFIKIFLYFIMGFAVSYSLEQNQPIRRSTILEGKSSLIDLIWNIFLDIFKKKKDLNIEPTDDSYYLPQAECNNYSPTDVAKIINPYTSIIPNFRRKMFNSLYFRCASCIVIAQEINKTVDSIAIGEDDPEIEFEIIKEALESLCENFSLRSLEDYKVVMYGIESSPYSSRVMNSHRLIKLRDICSLYLEHINMSILYNILLKKNRDTVDYFCRGDGVFRDCYNFNFKMTSRNNEDQQNEECLYEILNTF